MQVVAAVIQFGGLFVHSCLRKATISNISLHNMLSCGGYY